MPRNRRGALAKGLGQDFPIHERAAIYPAPIAAAGLLLQLDYVAKQQFVTDLSVGDNGDVSDVPSFADLVDAPDPPMDLLALSIAQEFRDVDAGHVLSALDALGAELAQGVAEVGGAPEDAARVCSEVLGVRHGFRGDREDYDDPGNSMLDLVLERRRGLPILLSVVYIEVGRRADVPIGGVGLPGHFVVGHFGADPPLLLDPFERGQLVTAVVADEFLRPWRAHEIAMRMLNNLVSSYQRRANLTAAIRAASMRLSLPAERSGTSTLQAELLALQARLN